MELRFRCLHVFVSFQHGSTGLCAVICQQVAMLQLWTTDLICWMMRSWGKTEARAKRSLVRPWLSADRQLQFRHYDQPIRATRIEDSSSFFHYLRMETLRVGHRIKKSDTSFRMMSLRKVWAGQSNRREVATMKIPICYYYDLGAFIALLSFLLRCVSFWP